MVQGASSGPAQHGLTIPAYRGWRKELPGPPEHGMGQLSLLVEGGASSSLRSTRAKHGPTIPAYRGRCKQLPQVHQSTAWANYPCLPKAVQGASSGPPEHGMGQLSLLTDGGARSSLRSIRAQHGLTIPAYRRRCKELPRPPEHDMGQLSSS